MNDLTTIAKLLRYHSLTSTSAAGSGHPTSCLSAADLMATLVFGGHFTVDIKNPDNPNNDRLIFSKGHAAPLFYALWAVAGAIPEKELLSLRALGSRLEGHPTMRFPFTEVPTGSLGQGLGVGVGMALNAKYLDKSTYRTYVLLGDSEMAEGSVWESMQVASHYKLDNLVGIIDVNRLGQRGETMMGHNLELFEDRVRSFGWFPIMIDGHDTAEIAGAFETAKKVTDRPVMVIAKTFKGKGVSFLEDKEAKHGVALKKEELEKALFELGDVDATVTAPIPKPAETATGSAPIDPPASLTRSTAGRLSTNDYVLGSSVSTREAYGYAIAQLAKQNQNVVVLDAETSNSTFAETVKRDTPQQFFEMYIAEGNMVGVGTGLARRGKIPFVSSFSAFFSRAFDQLRMAGYAEVNLKVVGSHAGVSIGEDGTSQMGLEDIAMMRSVFGSTVLYPSDGVSTVKLVEEMAKHKGVTYLRTTRGKTAVIYDEKETFLIGGCKVHKIGDKPHTHVIIGAGITLHEALKAQKELAAKGTIALVVDLYSIKPVDSKTLLEVTHGVKKVVVVEDHYEAGGIAEVVRSAIGNTGVEIISLAVRKMPQSGKPEELLRYEEIDAEEIINVLV